MANVGSINARVALDTADFRSGIKAVGQQMAIAREDFRLATAGLDRVQDAMQIAQARAASLTEQIRLQETIVERNREAHRQAAAQFGENSTQATNYLLTLRRSEGALSDLRVNLDRTNQTLAQQSQATQTSSAGMSRLADVAREAGTKMAAGFKEVSLMAGKIALSFAAIGAAAGGAAIVKGVQVTEELHKALNGLQAATGTADEGMQSMRDAMLDIYNNNFGESFEDIGSSMQTIAQQTKLTGTELSNATKNALAVKDTFGIEVTESIRSANQLMKNFGLSGESAYNLIAQGAQGGLNANENLADTINEYSVHFASIGLNATDMFNMMSSGAESGVFDIDKLGDAVKEFGIRTKDSSKGTMEAFSALGLNATQVSNDFAAGGEKGKIAFELVTTKINEMKDPLAQTSVGTALFGTMWEDVGAKGIEALTQTTGKISLTNDALLKINEVKYNTFSEALSGLGRQFETGILIPVGEKVLPKLSEFASWINTKMPEIKEFIRVAMEQAGKIFDNVAKVVSEQLMPALTKLWDWVSPHLPLIQKIIQDSFDTITKIVIPEMIKVFDVLVKEALPVVMDVFNFLVDVIMPPVIAILKFIYTEVVPQLVKKFQELIPKIADTMKTMWAEVKPVIEFLVDAFKIAWPIIERAVSSAIDVISGIISGLLTTLKGIIQFVSGVFTGDWEKAWEGVKNIFGGVWQGIDAQLKGVINNIIWSVNQMISSLNKLKFSFPEWIPGMGGKSFALNIPKIPSFETGVTNFAGGLARINEKGGEIVNLPNGSNVIPHDLSSKVGQTININIENRGTVVGRNGMEEFAKIIGQKLGANFALSIGGDF